MSDVHNAPDTGGGEAVTVVTPAADTGHDLSVSQAAKALAAARHKPKPVEAAPVEAAPAEPELVEEANVAPAEEQATDEATKAAEPEETLPPIEPPRSWTKEAKDRWNALPREAQEEVARVEQSREREFRRSQNEAAETRKAIEAERQLVEQEKKEYRAKVAAYKKSLEDHQQAAFSDIQSVDDVTRVAQEDPFRYLQWDAHQKKMLAANWDAQQIEKQVTQEASAKRQEFIDKEYHLLVERIPDLADPKKAQEVREKVVLSLKDDGFTENDLAELSKSDVIHDHRIQLLLIDGTKYRDVLKAKNAAISKPVPPVQRPGTARPNGAAASEQIQALTNRLNNSGSLKDAAAVLAARRARR